MRSKMSRVVNSALEPVGIEIRRAPGRKATGDYYPTVPTCQVPYLSAKLEQFFGRRGDGWFVEVGAFDGYSYSNSWGLAERGWRGVMLEPIPEYAERCRRAHVRHPRVDVVEVAVSAGDGELGLRVGGAFTTASPDQAAELESQEWARGELTATEIRRPARTLDGVLREHGVPVGFEVLVVDVEGHEAAVFSGFDVAAWRPQMMIVELADVHPQLTQLRDEHASLYAELVSLDYVVAFKDAINTMLVRSDVYRAAVSRPGPER